MNSEEVKPLRKYQKIYRSIFWMGYVMVIIAAFVPLKYDLHDKTINVITFKLHLDQLLHAFVYFLICLYFLAGQFLGLTLFKENSFNKFILAVLILATVTEAVQIFVPSRAFNFFDWLANVIGIFIGLMVIWGRRRKADGKAEGGRRMAEGEEKKGKLDYSEYIKDESLQPSALSLSP